MPLFFYQSLNSNSSTHHGVSASNSQHFTRATHDAQAANQTPWKLAMPMASGDVAPEIPVHGPAQLVSSAAQGFMAKGQHQDSQFLSMVQGKARETHQHLIREFGKSCDLLVYGEMNGNHSEWGGIQAHAGQLVTAASTGKACNSFSVHASNTNSHEPLGSGMGWIAVKSGNVNVVFVHVPNDIAKSEDAAARFYQEINQHLISRGKGAIDLVMGDTNQSSSQFTPKALNKATGSNFVDAQINKQVEPIDAHERSFSGTNSNATKMYDVAVYNTATVRAGKLAYLSQTFAVTSGDKNKAAAITDHMGMAIEVVKSA